MDLCMVRDYYLLELGSVDVLRANDEAVDFPLELCLLSSLLLLAVLERGVEAPVLRFEAEGALQAELELAELIRSPLG